VKKRAFHRRLKTRLPRYPSDIREAAQKHRFDRRMIAAQMYPESHSNTAAGSHSGAYGLMQLTRSTAKTLPLLSYQKAEYGCCRGTEPIEYVKQTMIYYDILRHQGIEYRTDLKPLIKSTRNVI
jgi:membrane-bound lytic murein transglycosylase MltF